MTHPTPPAAAIEADALRAEVARLTQLVYGGKGGLPEGAVAWLDMGKSEAGLTFSKKHDSNRASKRNAMELFNRVPAGYYPLYLAPQAAPPIAQQGGVEVTDEMVERAFYTLAGHLQFPGLRDYDADMAGMRAALEAALASKADGFPECSGTPNDCPENEGHGCCKATQPAATGVGDSEWTDGQCIAFMGRALRHVDLVGEEGPSCDEIRQGVKAALTSRVDGAES